jgi:hypothetical protein
MNPIIEGELRTTLRVYCAAIGLCSLTALLFIYVIIKVARQIKCSDPVFLVMLSCLLMSLLWTIAYYSFETHLTLRQLHGQSIVFRTKWYCQSAIYDSQPAVFLALGTLLNINKWVYYTLRTRVYKQGMSPEGRHTLDSYKRWLLLLTSLLMTCVVAPYSKIIRDACNQAKYHDVLDLLAYIDNVTPRLFLTTEVIFAVLFVVFAFVSATTILTLKELVPLLYSQYRAFLIASSLSLTVPLALRFVLDVMYTRDQHWRHFLLNPDNKTRFSIYSILDFIVTTLVPIVSQLSTLVFGFIRKSLNTL